MSAYGTAEWGAGIVDDGGADMGFETEEVELSLEERLQLQSDLNPTVPFGLGAMVMIVPFFGIVAWALLVPNPMVPPGDGWLIPMRIAGFLSAGFASLAAMVLVLVLFQKPLGRRVLRKAIGARTVPEAYRLVFADGVISLVYNTGIRIDTPLSEVRSHAVKGRRILVLAAGKIACPVPNRALSAQGVREQFDSAFNSLEKHAAGKGRKDRRD